MIRGKYLAALGLLVAWGCADESRLTPSEVYDQLQRVSCSAISECSLQGHGYDLSVHVDSLTGRCSFYESFEDEEFLDVMSRGYVGVDEDAWSACRAELAACELSGSVCNRIFVGTQPEGGACVDGRECVSGECSVVPSEMACGVCGPGAAFEGLALGETCEFEEQCGAVPGAIVTCAFAEGSEGICAILPTHREGETCGTSVARCEEGTRCDDGGTCVPRGAPGEICDGGLSCQAGVYCDRAEDVEFGTCRGFELRRLGEGCLNTVPLGTILRVCDLGDGLVCDAILGECVRLRTAEEGEACDEPTTVCADGLACDGTSCVAKLADGEACEYDGQCRSDRCDRAFLAESGTCVANLVAGRCE